MRAELTIAALTMAIQRRRPRVGLVHHSDRGSQGGFKWSSQHLDSGDCDDHSKAAFGSIWAGTIAVTRSTAGGRTRGAAAVLGGDRGRPGE
jgi:transposase InsO family protein